MARLRGIHSAVVAIVVAVVMIAMGIAIITGVIPIGKHAAKKGVLEVLGTPTITTNGHVAITVKNIGNDQVTLGKIEVVYNNTIYSCDVGRAVAPGATQSVECDVTNNGQSPNINTNSDVVPGYLVTDYGTVNVNFVVISS